MEHFSFKKWHKDNDILCWYRDEASQYANQLKTFVEILDGQIILCEVLIDKDKLELMSLFAGEFAGENSQQTAEIGGKKPMAKTEGIMMVNRDADGKQDLTVARKNQNRILAQTEEIKFSKGAMVGRPDSVEAVFFQMLEYFRQMRGTSPKHVHLLIPPAAMFNQVVAFPKMSRSELKLALQNEVRFLEEKRFKGATATIKVLSLGEQELLGIAKDYHLLCGLVREACVRYVQMISNNGLVCASISSLPLSYVYYFNNIREKGESLIFIELGSTSLRMFFFCRGTLLFIRPLMLSRTATIESFVGLLATQIEQTMLYFSQQNGDIDFDRFVVCDRTGKNIRETLSNQLGFPVESLDTTSFVEFSPRLREEIEKRQIDFNVPICAKVLQDKKPMLALVPQEFDDLGRQKKRKICVATFVACWLIAVVATFAHMHLTLSQRQQVLEQVEKINQGADVKTAPKLVQVLARAKEIESKHESMTAKHAGKHALHLAVQKILQNKYAWGNLMNGALSMRPAEITFLDIDLYLREPEGEDDGHRHQHDRGHHGHDQHRHQHNRGHGHGQQQQGDDEEKQPERYKLEIRGLTNGSYKEAVRSFSQFKLDLSSQFEILREDLDSEGREFRLVITTKEPEEVEER